jgi:hypothetical protein
MKEDVEEYRNSEKKSNSGNEKQNNLNKYG